MMTTYRTTVPGGDVIEVGADWAQAACPVYGDEHGRQVADFRHNPMAALRAAVEDYLIHAGDDPKDPDTAAIVDDCIDQAEEVESGPVADDDGRASWVD